MGGKKAALISKMDRQSKHAMIFVHGLHGDPDGTWRQSKTSKTLPELLALDEKLNGIDVYSFGYPSNLVVNYDFREVSKILHSEIKAHLTGKDIILIAHSMGGLVVQQYLIDQFEQFNNTAVKQVKGIIYMAVPFEGSSKANFASWFVPYHKQVSSLIVNNPLLQELRENWVKYVFRGGQENLPDAMQCTISQLALYGARDWIVSKKSASPFHVGAEVIASDTGHKDICKIDQFSTEYKHIKKFVLDTFTTQITSTTTPMIVHVYGWDKQGFKEEPHYPLDWTKYFQISASSRILPSQDIWANEIQPQINFVSKEWSEKWAKQGGIVRVYAKLCLTGALLLGSRLSFTKGVKLEVEHYGQIWAADKDDPSYTVRPKYTPGNSSESKRAVLILSVTKDIHSEVEQHLVSTHSNFKKIVNLLPATGPGRDSVGNNKQALSFSISVKNEIEQLKNEGINEIHLYLNTPLSVALFIGHRLTASCPIQTFEFNGIGYVPSCQI